MADSSISAVDLFGETLTSKNGDVSTASALKDKYTMIYFSAHWCPPCRGFTPTLVTWYDDIVKTRSDVELVFVSSDNDETEFNDYYKEMPWLALPYSDRDGKARLSKRFKVNGIPSLVVLDKDGSLITDDGRSGVSEDPKGEKFPWIPPAFEDVMPSELTGKDGNVSSSALDDKYLMIYFSAHWCPPCRGFTPELVKAYNKLKEARSDFELMFVSSDRDEKAFNEYYGEMPWLALPYANRGAKSALSKIFAVNGIPSLIVLDKVGADGKRKVINTSARGEVENIESFPWHPKPFADLSKTMECNGGDINDNAAMIVFCENEDDDEQSKIVETLKKTAEAYKGKENLLFFFCKENAGIAPRVRELCGLSKKLDGVIYLKLDIPDDGGFYVCQKDTSTPEAVREFISDYKAKKLERQQLEK